MASLRSFARPPLTVAMAYWQCLRPRGWPPICVLLLLLWPNKLCLCSQMSDKFQCSCSLPIIWPNISSSFCCHSRMTLSNLIAPHFPTSAKQVFGFTVPLWHVNPSISFMPLDLFSQTHGSGSRLIVDSALTLHCCLRWFMSGSLLLFTLVLTLFAHLATICWHPKS